MGGAGGGRSLAGRLRLILKKVKRIVVTSCMNLQEARKISPLLGCVRALRYFYTIHQAPISQFLCWRYGRECTWSFSPCTISLNRR